MSKYEKAINILKEIMWDDFTISEDLKDKIRSVVSSFENEPSDTIKFMQPLETNTGVGWWDENRSKINEIIQSFNDWQTLHRFDSHEKSVLIARINSLKSWGMEEPNDFSDWQINLLDEMLDWTLSH